MQIPNFHDGFFEGLHIDDNKVIHFYVRTEEQKAFTLTLHGVAALRMSSVMAKNIILDIVVRSAEEITLADIRELYGLGSDAAQGQQLLNSARERELQLLELNPSYGADGLVMFERFEITATGEAPPSIPIMR